MIYVEKENTHDTQSNLLYYVTENNELYDANISNESYSISLSKKPCELYEQSEKDEKYRLCPDRIMLIGQPTFIKSIWTMPAVIKKKGILGNILRPDLYIIEYKKINEGDISLSEEPLFKQMSKKSYSYEYLSDDEPPSTFAFVITKIGTGHRTKVTKIGIIKDSNNNPLLVSGSEWLTVNIYNITTPEKKPVKNYQNTYLLDVINQTDKNYAVMGFNIKKSWFADKKFTIRSILLLNNDTENTFDINPEMVLGDLCKVFFDPIINDSKKENSFENILKKYNTIKKEIADKLTDDTCYFSDNQQFILAPREKSYYVTSTQNEKPTKKEIQNILNEKDASITASTFDFTNHTLFYATYDKGKQYNKVEINKINLSDILGIKKEAVKPTVPKEKLNLSCLKKKKNMSL